MIGRDGEIILPGSFLPVAEKYGLIGEIDRWVITQAVRLAASRRRVSRRTSPPPRSARRTSCPSSSSRSAKRSADPANLVFEITETALMNDIAAGEAFARGLADIGCGLALDDFGTGFGSFTYLKKLPITYLKIDIEFVRDLIDKPRQPARGQGHRQPGTRVRPPDDRRGRRGRTRADPAAGRRRGLRTGLPPRPTSAHD